MANLAWGKCAICEMVGDMEILDKDEWDEYRPEDFTEYEDSDMLMRCEECGEATFLSEMPTFPSEV